MPDGGPELAARPHWPRVATPLLLLALMSADARAVDRHAGYYYPAPASEETYVARAVTLGDTSRARRVAFVTELTSQMMSNPYPPPVVLFAKGEEAEKLIITSLYDHGHNTIYRMRALLALLSSRARSTPIFREHQVQDLFTFLDLLKLLGFEQVTLTDGDAFAHRIVIE